MARLLKLACVIAVHCGLSLAVAACIVGHFKDVDFTLPRRVATPFLFSIDSTGVSIAYYKSWHNLPSTFNSRSPSENHWTSIFESPSQSNWDNGVFAYRDHVSVPLSDQAMLQLMWKSSRAVPRGLGSKVWPRRLGVHHWFLLILSICLFLIVHRRYIYQVRGRLLPRSQLSNRL